MKNNMTAGASAGVSRTRVWDFSVTAMFTAIILIMAFTPIGLIDLPLIKATILHVPVIIGCLLLGPKKGAFFGFLFGLTSLIKNTMTPSILSFAFTPVVPVPGLGRGSVAALIICFVPRILVGVIPWLVYKGVTGAVTRSGNKVGAALRTGLMAVCGALGALVNTSLVMGMIYIFFREAYASANGIPVKQVLGVILGVVATNGVPEAIVAAVLVPAIGMALYRAGVVESGR